ncbi:MAG: serine hydrolase [Sphingomicrobium sp.]
MTSLSILAIGAALGMLSAQGPLPAQPPASATTVAPVAPAALADRIRLLGAGFDGRVGIAVRSVEDGWQTGWRADELYPQQSVSKLWVAITAMDSLDRGKVRLEDRVTVVRSDLTLFHQPIAAEVLEKGAVVTTIGRLLNDAITKSDNTCNDRLMRSVGGAKAVRAMIAAKALGRIRFDNGERLFQSKVAGVTWVQSMAVGGGFERARDAVPLARRKALIDHYIANPSDGAAPAAVVEALARLKQGRLLSPSSTAYLLNVMGNTRTGKNRLRGGLAPGWSLSHKTGTGQELGALQAGYNDIGLITAPDGRSYAVAVMINATTTPLETRMTLMNEVVRAVVRAHDATAGPPNFQGFGDNR